MATQMGAAGAAPFAFVAKTNGVDWNAVLSFDVERLVNGQVAPADLNRLDDVARLLEEAQIAPEPGVPPEESALRMARLATILQLSSEYQAMRAEVSGTRRGRLGKEDIHPTRTPPLSNAFFVPGH